MKSPKKLVRDMIGKSQLDWDRPKKGKFRRANWDSESRIQSSGEGHQCGLCGATFPSLGALHEHKYREHKRSDGQGLKTYDYGG